MARRSDHSREELREMALNVAEQLLDEIAYTDISTRKIAAKMGYSVGTLYQLYDNLPHLLLHVNARTLALFATKCSGSYHPSNSPVENIKAYTKTYGHFIKKYKVRWQLIFDQNLFVKISRPECYTLQLKQLFILLETELKRIRPDKNEQEINSTAYLLWSSIHGIYSMKQTNLVHSINNTQSDQQLIEVLIDHFISGWKTSK